MRPAALLAVALVTLSACGESGPPTTPPEGWVADGDRWYVPGTDTSAAFRDLSTIEAMGVARDDSEYTRWFQERLTQIYRSNPEVADSVFEAQFLPTLREGVPSGEAYGPAAEARVAEVSREFFQRFNGARFDARTAPPLAIPADLQDVSGQVTVQVYVGADKEPRAVTLVEGTGTPMDDVLLRRAADADYTDGWVRPTAGQSGGVNIPTWVYITTRLGE